MGGIRTAWTEQNKGANDGWVTGAPAPAAPTSYIAFGFGPVLPATPDGVPPPNPLTGWAEQSSPAASFAEQNATGCTWTKVDVGR